MLHAENDDNGSTSSTDSSIDFNCPEEERK